MNPETRNARIVMALTLVLVIAVWTHALLSY